MAESTRNERGQDGGDLAAAARDRGMEHMERAKGQLADGAERVAAAVDRTADELEREDQDAVSGFGHSAASLMRQLAGGLRERDVDDFARELAALARRNPGIFLAGSVALGFGIARFFKARPRSEASRDYGTTLPEGGWHNATEPSHDQRGDYDAEEGLDLSASPAEREQKTRAGGKPKAKPQRSAASGSQKAGEGGTQAPPTEPAPADRPTTGGGSGITGGTGSVRGGKS